VVNIYPFVKPFLFQLDAEKAHHLMINVLKNTALAKLGAPAAIEHPALAREVMGLHFPNPIGLAAGLDKNAEVIDGMAAMGFGFVEIGTITPKPQDGNPTPRLFRLKQNEAIINRMGFNNVGALQAARNLEKRKSPIIVGANIGKNKVTDNKDAVKDYLICFEALHNLVDYFVVNVSSPNTPGLRELQEKSFLANLFSVLQNANSKRSKQKPILLKVAPDLDFEQVREMAEVVNENNLAGLIATNTTISREKLPRYLPSEIEAYGAGGLSGQPLTEKSTAILKQFRKLVEPTIPIIGVGGIMNAADALEKMEAGASLIQLYSGFIYKGPTLIQQIQEAIIAESNS
jgi:dihydroorotate dehydrogenase